jgi:DNA-binding CsgD family transcriptional regulator
LLLVDADARLIHVNAAGRAIVAADDVLRAIGGRLVARDGRANQALREILAAGGEAPTGTKGIAFALTAAGGERYVAHMLPLTAGARRRAGIGYAATAAVFVRKAALGGAASDALAEACRLTPTELRVLLAIVDIGGVPEVAAALGVAASTIKTHLGRVFQKTGAIRQADLVKLVAGFSSPMVH